MTNSPLLPINNNRPWWHCATMMMTYTFCLRSADLSLVQVGSFWAATALHKSIFQPTARIRARQGEARTVASTHIIGELLVLITCHCCNTTFSLTFKKKKLLIQRKSTKLCYCLCIQKAKQKLTI